MSLKFCLPTNERAKKSLYKGLCPSLYAYLVRAYMYISDFETKPRKIAIAGRQEKRKKKKGHLTFVHFLT